MHVDRSATELSTPVATTDHEVCTIPVFYPHKGVYNGHKINRQFLLYKKLCCVGVLKSSGEKATMKFHTSTDKEPKVYTITTVGDIDTVISLLG